jgi:hypothetical protein
MLPGGRTCLLAVGGNNISLVPAGATLNLPKCALASLSTSGSSIVLSGSGYPNINAAAIATAGNVQITGGSSLPPHTYAYFPLQDPYKNVTTAPLSGSIPPGPCNPQAQPPAQALDDGHQHTVPISTIYCGLTVSVNGTSVTLPPNYYIGPGGLTITAPLTGTVTVTFGGGITYIGQGGINIEGCGNGCAGSVNVTFGPGLYYIDGANFSISGLSNSARVAGSGVTIVLTNVTQARAGRIDIESNACGANISLSAPGSGQGLLQPSATASQGLLFFQDPTAVTANTPQPNVITSCATPNVTLNGAIYTPASTTNLQGNAVAGAKGCTEVIAQSFTVNGNPAFDDTGCSPGMTLNQAQIRQVYLVM